MTRVLIIEDDSLVSRTIAAHLKKKGYELKLAETGEEGLKLYRDFQPDLTLLDVKLPDLNGLEVLRQIRQTSKNAAVLVMTAFDDMKTTIEAIKAGAFEYLVKPLDYLELDLTIDKAFQLKALEEKVSYLIEERQKEYQIDNIIGRSPQMREVFKNDWFGGQHQGQRPDSGGERDG